MKKMIAIFCFVMVCFLQSLFCMKSNEIPCKIERVLKIPLSDKFKKVIVLFTGSNIYNYDEYSFTAHFSDDSFVGNCYLNESPFHILTGGIYLQRCGSLPYSGSLEPSCLDKKIIFTHQGFYFTYLYK